MRLRSTTVARSRRGMGERLDYGEEILGHGEFAEGGGLLGEVTEAEAGALVHAEFGDLATVESNATAGGGHEADNHVKGGGLAGAVGAEEADDLTGGDVEIDAIDDIAGAEGFDEALRDDARGGRRGGGNGRHYLTG